MVGGGATASDQLRQTGQSTTLANLVRSTASAGFSWTLAEGGAIISAESDSNGSKITV